jgi:hypothetical protein
MRRRFNYTNRIRIPQEKISINVNKNNGQIESFDANIDLKDLHFSEKARLYVEVYHRTDRKQFDFGTIENMAKPKDTSLLDFVYTQNLQFRVKIVDINEKHGLILGHADKIKLTKGLTKSILPVDFRDLGKQIWIIEMTGDEGAPMLVLNEKIPNIKSVSKNDPAFILFVYPSVFKQILTQMIIDGVDDVDDPSVTWHKDWINFTKTISPTITTPTILDVKHDDFKQDEAMNWINKIIEEFCYKRKEWKEFIKIQQGEN